MKFGAVSSNYKINLTNDTVSEISNIKIFCCKIRQEWMGSVFDGLISLEDDRETEIIAVGRENGVNVLGGLNDSRIT